MENVKVMTLSFISNGIKKTLTENQKCRIGIGLASNQGGYLFRIPESWELWRVR